MTYVPRPRKKSEKPTTVTRVYKCFGVDFRSDDTEIYYSPDSVNMFRSLSGKWETHPGFRSMGVLPDDDEGYDIIKFEFMTGGTLTTQVLIHAGTHLYKWTNYPTAYDAGDLVSVYDSMPESAMAHAVFTVGTDSKLLLVGSGNFLVYDGSTMSSIITDAFIPKIWTAKSPDASSGSALQQRNLIQPGFIEGFAGDGTAEYTLSLQNLDATAVTIKVDGVDKTENTHFTVNRTTGKITFSGGNEPPDTTGRESVLVTAYKTETGYADMILDATTILVFDNRVFAVNPDFPNRIFWTGFQEPSYWGEIMYNDRCGSGSTAIQSMQMLSSDKFLAIKSNTQQDGSYAVIQPKDVYDSDGNIDENNPKTYEAIQGSGTVGSVGARSSKVFVDDNIYLSTNGFNAISRELNISSERNIEHRSTMIDPKLLLEDLTKCVIEQYDNRLYALFTDTGHVYMADSNLKIEAGQVSPYMEYRWAYLSDIGIYKGQTYNSETEAYEDGTFYPALNIVNLGDKELYLCCSGMICKFNFDMTVADRANEIAAAAYNFNGREIGDYWKGPFDWFDHSNYYKRLNTGRNDLLMNAREDAQIDITSRTEKTLLEDSKVVTLNSSGGLNWEDWNFESFSWEGLGNPSYVLSKMRVRDFRRFQMCIASAHVNRCTAIESVTLEAEILNSNLK